MMKVLQISFILVLSVLLLHQVHAQAPVVTSLSPQDNAEGVSPQVNLVITFDVPVQKGEGEIVITQKNGVVFETIDIESSRISILEGSKVIIDPTNNFNLTTSYNVKIGAGAIQSLTGDPYGGILNHTTWNFTTGCGPAPSNLKNGFVSNNFAVLTWDEVPGITEYQLWISGIGIRSINDGSHDYLLTNLVPGTQYKWSIKSICRGTEGTSFSSSAASSFYTAGTSPCASLPSNLTVTELSSNSARLNWDSKTGVSDYQLWISGLGVINTTNGANSYLLNGLSAGTEYSWAVKSKCGGGGNTIFGDYAYGTFTTSGLNACSSPPTGLSATTTENSATLQWEAKELGTDYQLYISGIGIINSTNGTNSYFISDLPAGSSYSWSVKAKCTGSGNTVFTEATSSQFVTAGLNSCSLPLTGLTAETDETSALLSWDAREDITDYQVFVSGVGLISSTSGVNGYLVSGLQPGSTYTWNVKGICSGSNTAFSPLASGQFSTDGINPCGQAPTNTAVDITENSVELRWDPVAGVSDYQLYISGIGVIRSTGGIPSYTLTEYEVGSTYTWSVKSRCSGSRTTFSSLSYGPQFTVTTPVLLSENGSSAEGAVKELSDQTFLMDSENTSLAEEEVSVIAYPNPSQDDVNIELSGSELISTIVVRNAHGETVAEFSQINLYSTGLSFRQYGRGIYFISVVTDKGRILSKKVVIN